MARRPKRPAKRLDVLEALREKVAADEFRDTRHTGAERRPERGISLEEVRQVLEGGFHEAARDRYEANHGAWSYAIRGRTLDDRDLRIVVAFDEEDDYLVLVTTIDLDTDREGSS
jgi:hypothetical protein